MPRSILANLETLAAKAGEGFAVANGAEIGNYGRKMINFLPKDFSTRA